MDRKNPMLIPRDTHFTNLLIADAHQKTFHGGPQLMLNYLSTKYFIQGAKRLVTTYVRKCVTCLRYAASTKPQLMGQLPPARVTPNRPVRSSGVDYAGPIQLRTSKGRDHRAYKGYICLFVCMATKAVHIEVVSDLTTKGFLAAFKRFVARRGHCRNIWSDNGTNIQGASKELDALLRSKNRGIANEIAAALATEGTTWHFIPPHAPNFGGLTAVQQMTQHFWRRWSNEYLTTLLHRYKWSKQTPEPEVGDIVLIKEDNLPPCRWLLGQGD
ncbi:hypothetical protein PYW08_006161 [Mythimna loreyi]|uniref:Uncharacterized protein n=1 Tax=Mythimna loreyi TaxID=667449 RepID=A0ACC2QMY1_9NEOP|nr:hypothetical protein PYW08_006161 [Mythimna loreyi]